ncbi:DUF4183 domain-containing protein [Clostridiaceae bacterium M8S5]|nr:DUF4183 domain-containing protein [Clostridiaceae bacterium M8S5]
MNGYTKSLVNAQVYQYNAFAVEGQTEYTNADEITEYGTRGILDPLSVSYYDLFINGVLQPKTNYTIEEGLLTLTTNNTPVEGSPIIISFVTFNNTVDVNEAKGQGTIPSGQTCIEVSSDVDIIINNNNSFTDIENLGLVFENSVHKHVTPIAGYNIEWGSFFKLKNIGSTTFNNITVTTTVFLDKIIKIFFPMLQNPKVNGVINGNTILWNISSISPNETIYFNYYTNGYFITSGKRYLNKSYLTVDTSSSSVISDMISGFAQDIENGLQITNTMISGPLEIATLNQNTWRIELKVTNSSSVDLYNITVNDVLSENFNINNISDISISKGTTKLQPSSYIWNIGTLKSSQSVLLVFNIEGSFSNTGFYNIGEATVTGNVLNDTPYGPIITSGPSRDIQIVVSDQYTQINQLNLQKAITLGSLYSMIGIKNAYHFSLKLTNNTNMPLVNIIVTDNILLDTIISLKNISVTTGSVIISNKTITWNINSLEPYESAQAYFKVSGYFVSNGYRSLNRSLAFAMLLNNDYVLSNIQSGSSIYVTNLSDLVTDCIITDKVYSHCRQRHCFDNIIIPIGCETFESIMFKEGFIVENTLIISPIKNRPNFNRVQFALRVPYTITTTNNNTIDGCLPDIYKDIVLFIPESRDEFSFKIVVETSSKLLNEPYKSNEDLNFAAGVFIITKVVGKVQLLIPAFNFTPTLLPCIEADSDQLCDEFFNEEFPDFYPPQFESIYQVIDDIGTDDPSECIPAPGPPIFGQLTMSKIVVNGPLSISLNEPNTWFFEIRVTNDGNGPISNIVVVDTLLLDDIESIDIESVSQGTATVEYNKIIWNVGELPSVTMATLSVQVTGSFNVIEKQFQTENSHYFAISDGIKTQFTNADGIAEYSSDNIPNPSTVSFFNLYINGVLQPPVNYSVNENLLTLTTTDIPLANSPIILQYLIIQDENNQLLKANTYQYNTVADNKKEYTNSDEIAAYGDKGILNPKDASYYHLNVNGVLQPVVNYSVLEGLLDLQTLDIPITNSPMTLKFITIHTD